MALEAHLSLRADHLSPVGRERIRLLEAVAREGSISGAARAVGLTYKAAWDGLDAMANLFGTPVIETQKGGRAGGGAVLTPAGRSLIGAFHRMEAELERILRALEPELAPSGLAPAHVLTGFLMRTSGRNVLRGTVTAIADDAISAEVTLAVSQQTTIHALITRESMVSLGLIPGAQAIALVKTSFVMLADPAVVPRLSARNRIPGVVSRVTQEGVGAEVVLDIGEGRTLAATITAESVASLALAPGIATCAVFDASHVILAVD
ncbi:MAG: TOBE domain-containing protein [Alsobacter sp.]